VGSLLGSLPPAEIHVESVAWISERKDVLYALFFLAALFFYVRYAREANLNMLRSEGFSIRETDQFYDICDELGVMVTQQLFGRSIPDEDLAIACIEDTILRIRNHPSLVHFLGHDETFPTDNLDAAYRDLIARYIPDRTYQPHSGAFEVHHRFETGGTRTGTRELWTYADPTRYYNTDYPSAPGGSRNPVASAALSPCPKACAAPYPRISYGPCGRRPCPSTP